MSGLPDHLPPAPPEGARELAELLSFATRVEPELIRAVRLRFLPWLDAGAEADLWFSSWVGARSPEAVALLPECLPHLRAGLVERLRSDPALGEVFDVVEAHHRGLSPALLLEERVTWHTLTGDLEAADRQLDRALHALVREERSGLAGWFAEAWHRLPDEARSITTAWRLAHASRPHVPAFDAGQPPHLDLADIAPITGSVGEVRLGVLREGTALTLGQVRGRHAAAVLVPATDPRLVEVVTDSGTRTVRVDRNAVVRIEVGGGRVELRTGAGAVYRVEPVSAPSVPRGVWARVDSVLRELGDAEPGPETVARVGGVLEDLLGLFRSEDDTIALHAAVRIGDRVAGDGLLPQELLGLGHLVGEVYLAHGLRLGHRRSLERAMRVSGQLLDLPGHETDPTARAVRGGALRGLFSYTGDVGSLFRALETLAPVPVRPTGTEEEPGHRRVVAELLSTYAVLYETTLRDDLLRGAMILADTIVGRPEEEASCALPLARLLLSHHEATGAPGALRHADRLVRTGESAAEPRDVRVERELLLARSSLARFRTYGVREAFEEALERARWAVSLASPDNELQSTPPRLLLADVLRLRFALTHEPEALDEAVAVLRDVAGSLPVSSPWHGAAHHDLARCLVDGYRRSGRADELEAAREACRVVLSEGWSREPALARRQEAQSLIGECLLLAHVASGSPETLREAVQGLLEIVENSETGNTGRPRFLTAHRPAWYPTAGIVSALLEIPADAPGAVDLVELVDLWERAVRSSETVDPTLREAALSSLFLVRSGLTSGPLASSRHALVEAAEDARRAAEDAVHPLWRLRALLHCGELAVRLGAGEIVADVHERATRELAPLRFLPPDRAHEALVTSWERLSREAAAHAIDAGLPTRALDILEQRGRMLAEYGADRPEEPSSAPAAEVRWLWAYLHLDVERVSQANPLRKEAWRRATRFADAAPAVSGPSGSFAAEAASRPASVASEGPVVVLNAAARRCDALLVTRQGVTVLPLDVRLGELREHVQRFRTVPLEDPSEGWAVLGWLGASTVWPVLNALGLADHRPALYALEPTNHRPALEAIGPTDHRPTGDAPGPADHRPAVGQDGPPEPAVRAEDETLPRIWWCPTGPFTMLPLHAAGTPERSAMDHAVHSYTPSLHALARARHRERRADEGAVQSMLLVLSGEGLRWAREEVGLIRERVPHAQVLEGPHVTVGEVIARLADHSFFHYSGHAGWHAGTSLLHISEGLGRRHLPRGFVPDGALAYLSACDTAGGHAGGDGAGWTIAASFQSAGFRHVIGTVGDVEEKTAMLVATSFYRSLRAPSRRLSPEHSARALHGAVRSARARGPLGLLRAAALVHLGP
ncbi:CHAT domain-containing protein [Streptomyces cinereoruber]|uniref:CHAT domain-containing protein n=1 Tax=Streptomyces cinereoruber TaxID=67260 RepID=UPI00345E017C